MKTFILAMILPMTIQCTSMDDLKDYTKRMITKHTLELAKLELLYPNGHVKAYTEGKIMAYMEMQLIIELSEKKINLQKNTND